MQPRSFILAVNLHSATLFQPKGKGLEQRALFSDAAWKYEQEFTDRAGRGNKRALLSRYTLDKEGAAEDAVKDHFFKEIGSYLDKELKKGSFAHLYLFAEPQALGFLRKHSSKELLKSIVYSSHKDILPQTGKEILEKLKKEGILPK